MAGLTDAWQAAGRLAAAGADAASGDVLSQLLGYGVPGVVIVLIVTRVLVPGWIVGRQDQAHAAEIARQDAAHAAEVAAKDQTIAARDAEVVALRKALDEGNAFVRDQAVPVLTRSAEIISRYVDALDRRSEADHR